MKLEKVERIPDIRNRFAEKSEYVDMVVGFSNSEHDMVEVKEFSIKCQSLYQQLRLAIIRARIDRKLKQEIKAICRGERVYLKKVKK